MSGYREICLILVLVCLSPAILERNLDVSSLPAYNLNYSVNYAFPRGEIPPNCSRKTGEQFLSQAFVAKEEELQSHCRAEAGSDRVFAVVKVLKMAYVEVFVDASKMLIKTSLKVTLGSPDGVRGDIEQCYKAVNRTIVHRSFGDGVHSLVTDGCPEGKMEPQQITFQSGKWVCADNGTYDETLWSCNTSSAILPGEGEVAPGESHTQAPRVTSPSEGDTSLLTTHPREVTTAESMKDSWGIKLKNLTGTVIHLVEGEDEYILPVDVWFNRTKLCGQDKHCKLSINVDFVHKVNSQPQCRRTGASIPQVVVGQPARGGGDTYCSINVPDDVSQLEDTIAIKAMMDGKYDGLQTRYLHLSLTRILGQNSEDILRDDTFKTIQVEIEDKDRKATCQSINDPHITTFDGLEYNNYYEGEYILYQHKTLPLRVDLVYQKCASNVEASCNCAVAVQSGDDVIVIDRCYRDRKEVPPIQLNGANKNKNSRQYSRPATRMSVVLYLNGNLTAGTKVFQEADGKKYFIYLPSGAHVKVMVSSELLNAWLVASPSDLRQTAGLCGVYNWDATDDIRLQNGTILQEPEILSGRRGQPRASFIKDWRVALYGENSIIQGVAEAEVPYQPKKYCTCEQGFDPSENVCVPAGDVNNCEVERGSDVTEWLLSRAVKPDITSTRNKRDIEDNRIDIFPTEPPIKIDKKFEPPTYSWDKHWNEATAKDHCRRYIRDEYEIGQLCSQIPGVNFDQEVRTCVEDIQITGNTSWADSARDAMKEQCLEAVQKNSSLPKEIVDKIQNAMCVNDCSGHGQCVEGRCRCHSGYTSSDCSVDESLPPYSSELPTYGLCDVRSMNCSHVIVYGKDFVRSPNLTCFLRESEVTENTYIPSDTVIKTKGTFVTFNAVECPVPRTRSYLISVSNNGIDASDALLFIPFDPVCNNCSTFSKTCKKEHNSCIIDGRCYREGEHSPNDVCLVCAPVDDGYQWTTLKDATCRPAWWKDIQLPDWVVAVAAAVGGSLIGVLVGFLLYKCCCKSKKSSAGPDRSTDTASDNEGTPAFEESMLHRNRGLPPLPNDGFADIDLPHADEYEGSYFYNGDGSGVENGVDSTTYF